MKFIQCAKHLGRNIRAMEESLRQWQYDNNLYFTLSSKIANIFEKIKEV